MAVLPLAAVAIPVEAAAVPQLGVDLNLNNPMDRSDVDTGGGGALRFGEKWEFLIFTLTPEVAAGYAGFGGEADAAVYQLMGGARFGLGFIVEPSIFAHAGAGYLDQQTSDSGIGLTYDIGAALDLTLLPVIDLGIHVAFVEATEPSDNAQNLTWTTLGAHVGIELE